MPTPTPDPPEKAKPAPRPTLDEIFGDVLPDTTKDDRDPSPTTTPDEWYEQNRPPHHGG